jgi:hypothetical protein
MNPRQVGSFDSMRVEAEIKASAASLGGEQPTDNSIPGESATWRAAYDRVKRGEPFSSLSRARFRADLTGVSRAEKDHAIARLSLPEEHPLAMPPARLRVLSAEARQRAIDVLRE